jgi:hypothetical protein
MMHLYIEKKISKEEIKKTISFIKATKINKILMCKFNQGTIKH